MLLRVTIPKLSMRWTFPAFCPLSFRLENSIHGDNLMSTDIYVLQSLVSSMHFFQRSAKLDLRLYTLVTWPNHRPIFGVLLRVPCLGQTIVAIGMKMGTWVCCFTVLTSFESPYNSSQMSRTECSVPLEFRKKPLSLFPCVLCFHAGCISEPWIDIAFQTTLNLTPRANWRAHQAYI